MRATVNHLRSLYPLFFVWLVSCSVEVETKRNDTPTQPGSEPATAVSEDVAKEKNQTQGSSPPALPTPTPTLAPLEGDPTPTPEESPESTPSPTTTASKLGLLGAVAIGNEAAPEEPNDEAAEQGDASEANE